MSAADTDEKFIRLLAQESLAARGFYKGEFDGIWGPKSKAALTAYKKSMSSKTGIDRMDWRGFVPANVTRLTLALPLQAQPLVDSFVNNAFAHDLNPLFLIAISKHETGAWTSRAFREKNNAMGISNSKGPITLASHDDSIKRMAKALSSSTGYYANCKTLADVADVYAPPGAGNDPGDLNPYWPRSVAKFWEEFEQAVAA